MSSDYGTTQVVYVVLSARSQAVKIGITNNVRRRFGDICTHCPGHLALVGTIEPRLGSARQLETFLHKTYEDFRIPGRNREWFDYAILDDDLLSQLLADGESLLVPANG